MNKMLTHITLTGLLCFSVVMSATAGYAATDWEQLNEEQRAVLKNLEDGWENIPDERRQRLIRNTGGHLQRPAGRAVDGAAHPHPAG